MKDVRAVMYQRPPQRIGNTTTAAALATSVKVIKLGMPGRLQIKGENKHHAATTRYIRECPTSIRLAWVGSFELQT